MFQRPLGLCEERSDQWPFLLCLANFGLAALALLTSTPCAFSQTSAETPPPAEEQKVDINEVDVSPLAEDEEIATRLQRILDATTWFQSPSVRVDEGIVFLAGKADTGTHKEWAGEVAAKTQDVVAVVNNMTVIEARMWDLSPARDALEQIGKDIIHALPFFAFGLVLLLLTLWTAKLSVRGTRVGLQRRVKNQLLRDVFSRVAAIPVLLLGMYLVLKVAGLTRLAVTVLGGTGLLGLVIGFAFRDIAENFLASILISIQRPFATGDYISVAGFSGVVQSVNTRSTLLMTLEGNHLQIPNATVYKETITNFTANPLIRMDFTVGIGYADECSQAQSIALSVLQEHEAVLNDPESLVLVEALGASTVNLRIYFWIDGSKFNGLKVRSAVVRMTKNAFEAAGISMPDEAREVIFPQGISVNLLREPRQGDTRPEKQRKSAAEPACHPAEGDLRSETEAIQQQARNSRVPEGGQNLLDLQ